MFFVVQWYEVGWFKKFCKVGQFEKSLVSSALFEPPNVTKFSEPPGFAELSNCLASQSFAKLCEVLRSFAKSGGPESVDDTKNFSNGPASQGFFLESDSLKK